jgi:glucose/mannose transport system permease protein
MSIGKRLSRAMPGVVLSPSLAAVAICVYGFIAYTAVLSFTGSKMFARFDFVGFRQYDRLFQDPRWSTAIENMGIFAGLYLVGATCLGLFLAILIDQRIRLEGVFRAIFLYPMALSFVVTGVIWQWLLNPGLGLEHMMRGIGWSTFTFQWLIEPDRAIYTRIIIPALRPVFLTVFVIEAHLAIKSYDLVVALTKGGPGVSTELPSTFMYSMTFTRNELAVGAASATAMLITLAAIIIPYLYSELRDEPQT